MWPRGAFPAQGQPMPEPPDLEVLGLSASERIGARAAEFQHLPVRPRQPVRCRLRAQGQLARASVSAAAIGRILVVLLLSRRPAAHRGLHAPF